MPESPLPAAEAGGPQDIFVAPEPAIPLPLIERAEGIYMWDDAGNRYIDVSSGPVVCNIGHGVASVADAMAQQARTMDFAYYKVARHRPNTVLAEMIAGLAGQGYERVCFASGGSEAIEIAVKFLRQYALAKGETGRKRVISCMPSYHGGTFAALGISGDTDVEDFVDGLAIPSEKVPAPFTYRVPENHTAESYAEHCADELERTIRRLGPDSVLAFIIEPVGGVATGCLVPLDGYFRRVREICDRHGIKLIFDEVMAGSGRTGAFLSAHHWPDAKPDLVVLAKGLGAGYVPLGAMLAPADMADELARLTGFAYFHTYTANPVACAAGIAILDYMAEHDLIANARRMGEHLKTGLENLKRSTRIVGDVRGKGLLIGVELVADRDTKAPLPVAASATDRVRVHGLDNGLIIYSRRASGGRYGDWFLAAPPLTVSEADCDEIVERLGDTVRGLEGELEAAGHI